MTAQRLGRVLFLGATAALLTIGTLTGCSPTTEKEAPTSTPNTSTPTTAPTTGSSAPTVSPTEKAVGPGDGNSFSPTVNPTPPGAICKEVVNGVCIR